MSAIIPASGHCIERPFDLGAWLWRVLVVLSFWACMVTDADALLKVSVCGHASYDCPELIRDGSNAFDNKPGAVVGTNRVCDETGTKCVYVGMNPNQKGPTPAGWTSYTQPPATAAGIATYHVRDGTTAGSLAAACAANTAHLNSTAFMGFTNWQTSVCSETASNYSWRANVDGGNTATGPLENWGKFSSCPSGYTLQSGTCNLTNAAVVQKPADGNCTIIRSGNTFTGDANDPDCTVSGTTPAKTVNLGGNGSNNPTQSKDGDSASQKNNANGSSEITISFSNPNGTTTQIKYFLSTPDGDGKQTITGGTVTQQQGVGDQAGTGGGGGGGDEVCGASPLPPCNVKVDETGTPTDAALQAQKDDFNTKADAHKSKIEAQGGAEKKTDLGLGLSVGWLPAAGGCSNPSFTMPRSMGTLVVPACEYRADIQAVMYWLVAVGTMIYLLVLGAGAVGSRG